MCVSERERELLFNPSPNQTGLLFSFWFQVHMLRSLITYTHWAAGPLCGKGSFNAALHFQSHPAEDGKQRGELDSDWDSETGQGKKRNSNVTVSQYSSAPLPLFCFSTGRMHWKPPIKSLKTSPAPSASPTLSGPIRRSISCPRSIASLSSPNEVRSLSTRPSPTLPMATPLIRPSSATLRSHSLSRSGSAHRVPHSNSLGTIHSNIVSYSTHTVVAYQVGLTSSQFRMCHIICHSQKSLLNSFLNSQAVILLIVAILC